MTWLRLPGLPDGWNPLLSDALAEIESHRTKRKMPFRTFLPTITNFLRTSSWAFLISIGVGFLAFAYLIDALPSLFRLRWSRCPRLCALPEGVRRESARTWEGELELLVSGPSSKGAGKAPAILLLHGGFGSAGVWLPWMAHLRSTYPGPIYAVSLRGHGGSFSPGYVELTYLTSMTPLCADVSTAIARIAELEMSAGRDGGLVLVGHSSGGGLLQFGLGSGKIDLGKVGGKVKGLALVGSIPHFGSMGVYKNWLRADPWFLVRNFIHFGHPRGPLSSIHMVRNIFFSDEMKREEIEKFEEGMPEFESMQWPIQMMFGQFVEVGDVLERIEGGRNVLVMGGKGDKIISMDMMMRVVDEYEEGCRANGGKKLEAGWKKGNIEENDLGSVKLVIVSGSGHHLQNDVHADEAAEALGRWAGSL